LVQLQDWLRPLQELLRVKNVLPIMITPGFQLLLSKPTGQGTGGDGNEIRSYWGLRYQRGGTSIIDIKPLSANPRRWPRPASLSDLAYISHLSN
jgi:hypothetical protein